MVILKTHSNNARKKIMTATSISLSVNINEDEALEALTIFHDVIASKETSNKE
jgi:hypothetical protein